MSRRRAKRRSKLFAKSYHAPGTAPGTLTEEVISGAPRLRIIDYDAESHHEHEDAELEQCKTSLKSPDVTWIHVHGAAEPAVLRHLGENFGLHPLALEDVLNEGQRPKWELYGEDLFAILSYPRLDKSEVYIEQVSVFLGKNYLISFYEHEDDVFEPIRRRMRLPQQRFRGRGPDFLFYALTDLVIDAAFPLLDHLGEHIEAMELDLTDHHEPAQLKRIHHLKRQLITLRRFLWPHRDLLAALLRDEHGFLAEDTKVYLRDVYDHAVQVVDLIETYREMVGTLLEMYLSSQSNRLNEVMRVLTVISTIFMPLAFVVGVYGMNFEGGPYAMPELHWRYGYPAVWVVILAVAIGMLIYFRRKQWF
ncbi:MAG: magnesium/cobalt transporter CorA [Deltaproteobacteria bacterium]|nr:magnesium/cobalt transporter CorA [Deltaproteobacteria bacterium]